MIRTNPMFKMGPMIRTNPIDDRCALDSGHHAVASVSHGRSRRQARRRRLPQTAPLYRLALLKKGESMPSFTASSNDVSGWRGREAEREACPVRGSGTWSTMRAIGIQRSCTCTANIRFPIRHVHATERMIGSAQHSMTWDLMRRTLPSFPLPRAPTRCASAPAQRVGALSVARNVGTPALAAQHDDQHGLRRALGTEDATTSLIPKGVRRQVAPTVVADMGLRGTRRSPACHSEPAIGGPRCAGLGVIAVPALAARGRERARGGWSTAAPIGDRSGAARRHRPPDGMTRS